MKLVDLTGRRFGRWTVSRRAEVVGRPYWLCRCLCGATRAVMAKILVNGTSRSCGCYAQDRRTKHGHATRVDGVSREWHAWKNAKRRCHVQRSQRPKDWANYGGRGVYMVQRWRDSFATFIRDMGPCPPGLTLDRIDTNGPYSKTNCRWATRLVQARNKRKGPTLHVATVRAIRDAEGTYSEIAARHGIGAQHVGRIKRGERWGWLE
jgi:hypothetical protein